MKVLDSFSIVVRSLIFLTLVLSIASCANRPYISGHYDESVTGTETVAILPYQVIFQGTPPKNMKEEEMLEQDNKEKIAFQQSLYRYVGNRWRKSNFRLQDPSQTNNRLEQAGIDIYKIEDYTIEEIAAAAGVDLVFRATVVKHRYRGDLASMGLDVAQRTIQSMGGSPLPHISPRTNDVKITVSMLEGSDGISLWSNTRQGAASWNRPVSRVMDDIHKATVRRLPRK